MLEADTGNPLFPAWWRILNRATHSDPMRRYRSAKALRKDLLALRVKMFFMSRRFGLPRYVWCLIVVLAIVVTASVFRVKTAIDSSESRWKEWDDSIAEQVARQNEVNEQTFREQHDLMVQDQERRIAELEEHILAIDRQISEEEKLLAEKDRETDMDGIRSRIEAYIQEKNDLQKKKARETEELEKVRLKEKLRRQKK